MKLNFPAFRNRFACTCAAAFLILTLPIRFATADDDEDAIPPPPGRVVIENGQTYVVLTPDEVRRAGVEARPLKAATRAPDRHGFAVVADTAGLASDCSDLVSLQSALDAARSAASASTAEVARLRKLQDSGSGVAMKDVERAQAQAVSEASAVTVAKEKLAARRAVFRQKWGSVLLTWARNGSPKLKPVLDGSSVLISVTEPGAVTRQPVTSVTVMLPGEGSAEAKLVGRAGHENPQFQGTTSFYQVSGFGLLPGMNVEVTFPGMPFPNGVHAAAVPASAVVWWEGKPCIFREVKPGRFTRITLSGYLPAGDGGFVVPGLEVAPPVVVKNAELLLSEEFLPTSADD